MSCIISDMDLVSITRFLNGFLMIAIPIVLGIYLVNRFKMSWRLWLIGASTFVLSQVLHIPFNSYILSPLLSLTQNIRGTAGSLVTALLLGLSAGIFEECARYAMYRWWARDARSWRSGILAGAGHGGIEAILLGILVMVAYVYMMAYRNLDLNRLGLNPNQLQTAINQIQAYWSFPWYDTLLGALERVFTIPFHIVASVLVLQVFTRRPGSQRLGWLGLAILLHTLVDGSAVFILGQWGGYAVEAVLGVLAVIYIIIIFALRQPELIPVGLAATSPGIQPVVFPSTPIEETSENLENTRYQ